MLNMCLVDEKGERRSEEKVEKMGSQMDTQMALTRMVPTNCLLKWLVHQSQRIKIKVIVESGPKTSGKSGKVAPKIPHNQNRVSGVVQDI